MRFKKRSFKRRGSFKKGGRKRKKTIRISKYGSSRGGGRL